MISLDLRFLGNLANESFSRVMAVMSIPVVKALSAHELAQVPSISGQASNGNTHMIINIEDFLLMASQIVR